VGKIIKAAVGKTIKVAVTSAGVVEQITRAAAMNAAMVETITRAAVNLAPPKAVEGARTAGVPRAKRPTRSASVSPPPGNAVSTAVTMGGADA
jgi:hypothetical protein